MSGFNDRIIEQFRTNGGTVDMFGDDLVILHTRGAKSGEPREHPVLGIRDGDDWLVAASAAGAPTSPAWFHNLVAHPQLDLETPDGTVPVTATVPEGAERDALYARFVERSSGFADYETKAAPRVIPVVRLSPR